jgi:protein ImuA
VSRPPLSSSTTASSPVSTLTAHPLLWRGRQISHHIHTHNTGYADLDDALPGNGWPLGAVTELVNDTAGCGELSLLLPVLARLSHENHWIVMVDPPWIPYPSALYGRGLALEKLLLIRTQNRSESLWACEQVVCGISGGVMLAWPDSLSFSELRRLQLAAKTTQKTVFLFRDHKAVNSSSPAALRLQLSAADDDLQVKVLKCRGQRPASNIRIRRSQLFQPLIPPLVSSSGSSNRSRSSSESPVVSLATSRIGRPSL